MWNDDARQTTKQPHLAAIVKARHFLLSRWYRCQDLNWFPLGAHWDALNTSKTIQLHLKSNILSLVGVTDMAQNRLLWWLMSTFDACTPSGAWCQKLMNEYETLKGATWQWSALKCSVLVTRNTQTFISVIYKPTFSSCRLTSHVVILSV